MASFPYLRLTKKEIENQYGSVKNWYQSIMGSVDSLYSGVWYNQPNEIARLQRLQNLRAGELIVSDYDHIINELGIAKTEAFPVQLKNFPIITQLANALLGEEQNRPSNERVIQTNPDVVSLASEAKKNMLMQYFEADLYNQMLSMGMIQEGQPEQTQTPEEIERYMNMSYRDISEVLGQQSLDYLKMFCETKRKLDKGFDDLITFDREIFYVGSYFNEPFLRKCNLYFIDFDRSPDVEFIEDCAWVREIEYISSTEVYDRYADELTKEDVGRIESIKGTLSSQGSTGYGVPFFYHNDFNRSNGFDGTYVHNSSTVVKVEHLAFKALRQIFIVTSIDPETGAEYTHQEEEGYKKTKDDIEVKEDWVNEVHECTRIADDIIVKYGPRRNQGKSIDNPSKCKLPYIGYTYNKLTSNVHYSAPLLLESYQYEYNVTMYRFEHMMALAKGKAMVFDIAQIPKSYGFDVDKWIYYLTTANIAFVNSMEEDKKGQRSTFNQFTTLDMTLGNSIQYLITTLDQIKAAAGDLLGVTPQRMGQISSQELVGNVQQSVQYSTNITEYIFSTHATVKRNVLKALLEEAKWCWLEGKKAQYVLDDMTRVFLTLDPGMTSNWDLGVFVSNAVQDVQMFNTIKSLAQAAMQNGQATLSGLAKISRMNSPAQITATLEAMEAQMQQQQAQAGEQANQIAMMQTQMEAEEKEKDRQMDYLMNQEDNQTKIQVATITSLGFAQSNDSDKDGQLDIIEQEKLALDQKKLDIEQQKVNMGMAKEATNAALKNRELDLYEDIENKKIKASKNKPSSKKSS